MAQRLATEYVKTSLILSEAELSQLFVLFESHNLTFKVKVLENGNQEIAIDSKKGTDLVLTFERRLGRYILQGSCRIEEMSMANAMRKAVSEFKGDAIVNRIYEHYTVEYVYRQGAVVRITERNKQGDRLIYVHKDTVGQLTELYRLRHVEARIQAAKVEIDELLDQRVASKDAAERARIDGELKQAACRLFAMEA
jgi:hypothetical protein